MNSAVGPSFKVNFDKFCTCESHKKLILTNSVLASPVNSTRDPQK